MRLLGFVRVKNMLKFKYFSAKKETQVMSK
jgi:hypothetical protein